MSSVAVDPLYAQLVSPASESSWLHWWWQYGRDSFIMGRCLATSLPMDDQPAVAITAADDARDIAAAKRGDPEAFHKLVQRYQAAIALQMRRFTRDPRQCEDLVHEVFVTAYLALSSYRGAAPWLHWLRKIAVRVGYRLWKQRQRNSQDLQLTSEEWRQFRSSTTHLLSSHDAAELVSRLLAQLSPPDRLIMTLLYLDGCSMTEAAARAGWTVMGAKLRAFRARNKLRKIIQRGES